MNWKLQRRRNINSSKKYKKRKKWCKESKAQDINPRMILNSTLLISGIRPPSLKKWRKSWRSWPANWLCSRGPRQYCMPIRMLPLIVWRRRKRRMAFWAACRQRLIFRRFLRKSRKLMKIRRICWWRSPRLSLKFNRKWKRRRPNWLPRLLSINSLRKSIIKWIKNTKRKRLSMNK